MAVTFLTNEDKLIIDEQISSISKKDNVYVGDQEPTDSDIDIWINPDGEADPIVQCTPQEFTDSQQAQARDNIGAASKESVEQLFDEKVDKSYMVSIFNELKQLILSGNTGGAIAVLDQAILDNTILA